ncbi:MFS transporter [Christensenellaceae bacterium OttesenSCG-928-L17]|nr:MFS transporter [Christensenellaceae bacterium OttesenSCG-928-L17]
MEKNWKQNAVVFIGSQAVSLIGSAIVQYAVMWHITLTTQSGLYATLFIVCGFLPTLLLSPFGGVWADRYNRKMLIVLADGAIALSTLILALLYLAGYQELWLLFLVAGIRALGGAVQTPSVNAMLPDIVPVEALTRVNGIYSSVQSVASLLSPVLALLLLERTSLGAVFFVDVGTAALAIVILLVFLKLPARKIEQTGAPNYFLELKEGFSYIRQNRYLIHFFVYFAVLLVMMSPLAFLTPLQVSRTFGADAWRLNAIEIVFSVGMILGGLLMTVWSGLKNRLHTIAVSCIITAVCTILMGLPTSFWLYTLWMGICGLVMSLFNTQAMVVLQERVQADVMGRVFGVMSMISSSVAPLAMLAYGPLADVVSIETLMLITGIAMLITSIFMVFDKPLLEVGKRPLQVGEAVDRPDLDGYN